MVHAIGNCTPFSLLTEPGEETGTTSGRLLTPTLVNYSQTEPKEGVTRLGIRTSHLTSHLQKGERDLDTLSDHRQINGLFFKEVFSHPPSTF